MDCPIQKSLMFLVSQTPLWGICPGKLTGKVMRTNKVAYLRFADTDIISGNYLSLSFFNNLFMSG